MRRRPIETTQPNDTTQCTSPSTQTITDNSDSRVGRAVGWELPDPFVKGVGLAYLVLVVWQFVWLILAALSRFTRSPVPEDDAVWWWVSLFTMLAYLIGLCVLLFRIFVPYLLTDRKLAIVTMVLFLLFLFGTYLWIFMFAYFDSLYRNWHNRFLMALTETLGGFSQTVWDPVLQVFTNARDMPDVSRAFSTKLAAMDFMINQSIIVFIGMIIYLTMVQDFSDHPTE